MLCSHLNRDCNDSALTYATCQPAVSRAAGCFDATRIEFDRLDAWRPAHPESSLQDRGNPLHEENAILDALLPDDTVKVLAQQSGLTYMAPRSPAITPPITGKLLATEE